MNLRDVMRVAVIVGAGVASLASSVAPQGPPAKLVPYKPTVTKVPEGVTDDDLYAATIRVFADNGVTVVAKEKDAGIVATKPEYSGAVVDDMRVIQNWRVLMREGELTMEINCVRVPVSCGSFGCSREEPCSNEERSDAWVSMEPKIREAIMAEAAKKAGKRAPASAPTVSDPHP